FFGYGRYARCLRNERWLSRLPRGLRARDPGERARLGGLAALQAELAAGSFQARARNRVLRWRQPEAVVLGAQRARTAYDNPAALPRHGTPADALMAMDTACYLPEDILTKVDRASMAVALETRAPLLDWRGPGRAAPIPPAREWRGRRPH